MQPPFPIFPESYPQPARGGGAILLPATYKDDLQYVSAAVRLTTKRHPTLVVLDEDIKVATLSS